MNMNKVMVTGNLTRDVEVKSIGNGTMVANLSIANNQPYKDKNGETKQNTNFFEVVVWGKPAENCGKYLTKGQGVFVEGSLETQTWEDKTSGSKRSKVVIKAFSVQFGAKPKGKVETTTTVKKDEVNIVVEEEVSKPVDDEEEELF